MFVLDPNVVSELRKIRCPPLVLKIMRKRLARVRSRPTGDASV
jgi:hypothetical protein